MKLNEVTACTGTETKYFNYTVTKTNEEREHLKFTVNIIFFDAVIGSKSYMYMICTNFARQEYLSINGLRTADQPLHHERQWVLH